jgi:hypothetical protein
VDVGARKQFRVSAGMVVSAEFNLGIRTVMKYLLSPVEKVSREAGRGDVGPSHSGIMQLGRPTPLLFFCLALRCSLIPVCRSLITIVKTFCQ